MLQFIATSTTGLESVVSNELKRLGYMPRNSDMEVGRTFFEGELVDLVKANIWLRSAGKVLVKLAEFNVKDDFDVIFDAVKAIEWENWAPRDAAFIVVGRSVRSTITSVPALQKTVKKAIVSRLSQVWNLLTLPETGPKYEVEISLFKDHATVTLNSTGRGLHRRGYRLMNATAPLRETLAAALVQLSVWKSGRPFIDPFCGSGTIPIEAALIGRNIAPGIKRTFDAQNWPCIPHNLWFEAREEAHDLILPPLKEKICGSDIDEECVNLSRRHAQIAGVDQDIDFSRKDFKDLSDEREYGCVVCNPPYGDRLGESSQLRSLYESIPAVLSKLPTWSHFIITSWLDFTDLIGQEATRRRKLYNGRIECVYYQFLGPQPPKSFWQKVDDQPLEELGNHDTPPEPPETKNREGALESPERNNADGSTTPTPNEPPKITPVFPGLDAYADDQGYAIDRSKPDDMPKQVISDLTPWMYFRQVLARFDPENQYAVTLKAETDEEVEGILKMLSKETIISTPTLMLSADKTHYGWRMDMPIVVRTYKWQDMNGNDAYFIDWRRRCDPDKIAKVEKLEIPDDGTM